MNHHINTGGSIETNNINCDGAVPDNYRRKTVSLPSSKIGFIIGARGEHVNFIRRTSGAKITITNERDEKSFQELFIEGNQREVLRAIELVKSCLSYSEGASLSGNSLSAAKTIMHNHTNITGKVPTPKILPIPKRNQSTHIPALQPTARPVDSVPVAPTPRWATTNFYQHR
eukprot:UN33842